MFDVLTLNQVLKNSLHVKFTTSIGGGMHHRHVFTSLEGGKMTSLRLHTLILPNRYSILKAFDKFQANFSDVISL